MRRQGGIKPMNRRLEMLRATGLALAISLMTAECAFSQVAKQPVNLGPAQLGQTLLALSQTFGEQIIFSKSLVERRISAPLSGMYTADEALNAALKGSGLSYRRGRAGVIMVESATARIAPTKIVDAQPAPSTQEPDAPSASAQLEEVVVTAQRRSERLQDIPMAVTAVNAKQLAVSGVDNASDLRQVAPALNSQKINGSWVASSIRGIGSFSFGVGVEPSVAMYVDGVYLASPFAETLTLNNIASVEVLKGPQGTLFGRNATAGVILMTTSDPTADPHGNFEVGYGSYQTSSVKGYVAGGIAKNLTADFSFIGTFQGEGFGRNLATGNEAGRLNQDLISRTKWVWAPTDSTKFVLIGDAFNAYGSYSPVTGRPGSISGYIPGYIFPDLRQNVDTDVDTYRKLRGGGVSLRVDQTVGDLKFSSISAYRGSRLWEQADLDDTPVSIGKLLYGQDDRQFSQELQLSSRSGGKLQWTTGFYYYSAKSSNAPVILNFFGLFPNYVLTSDEYKSSPSIYGQATYALFTDTHLTVGARYSSETDEAKNAVQDSVVYPSQKSTTSSPTYRISLDHRFSENFLGYVSFNTGFKSGGFNSGSPGTAPYQPEKLKAYEVGLKTDLFDRRLRLNAAGYHYDYSNIQVLAVTNTALLVRNGPTASVYGLDADFDAILTHHFSLNGGINWMTSKFGNYPGCPVGSLTGGVPLNFTGTNCAGNQLPFAAKFTGSASVNYAAPLGGGNLRASLSAYCNSGYFYEPDNLLEERAYVLVNASAKWTASNGVSIGVFGKNLTNKRVLGTGTAGNGNQNAWYSDPITYGITLGYSF